MADNKKLNNTFLAVDKGLFKIGLNPTQILLMAQVLEYQRNTGNFFMSDETLGNQFGVSYKTISREIKDLCEKGYLVKETKNTQTGKKRNIVANLTAIQEAIKKAASGEESGEAGVEVSPTDKMSFPQRTNCPLRNGQNDFIKDKSKKIILKDKKDEVSSKLETSSAGFSANAENPLEPEAKGIEELGKPNNPIVKDKEWLLQRYNQLTNCGNGLFFYNNQYYRMEKEE